MTSNKKSGDIRNYFAVTPKDTLKKSDIRNFFPVTPKKRNTNTVSESPVVKRPRTEPVKKGALIAIDPAQEDGSEEESTVMEIPKDPVKEKVVKRPRNGPVEGGVLIAIDRAQEDGSDLESTTEPVNDEAVERPRNGPVKPMEGEGGALIAIDRVQDDDSEEEALTGFTIHCNVDSEPKDGTPRRKKADGTVSTGNQYGAILHVQMNSSLHHFGPCLDPAFDEFTQAFRSPVPISQCVVIPAITGLDAWSRPRSTLRTLMPRLFRAHVFYLGSGSIAPKIALNLESNCGCLNVRHYRRGLKNDLPITSSKIIDSCLRESSDNDRSLFKSYIRKAAQIITFVNEAAMNRVLRYYGEGQFSDCLILDEFSLSGAKRYMFLALKQVLEDRGRFQIAGEAPKLSLLPDNTCDGCGYCISPHHINMGSKGNPNYLRLLKYKRDFLNVFLTRLKRSMAEDNHLDEFPEFTAYIESQLPFVWKSNVVDISNAVKKVLSTSEERVRQIALFRECLISTGEVYGPCIGGADYSLPMMILYLAITTTMYLPHTLSKTCLKECNYLVWATISKSFKGYSEVTEQLCGSYNYCANPSHIHPSEMMARGSEQLTNDIGSSCEEESDEDEYNIVVNAEEDDEDEDYADGVAIDIGNMSTDEIMERLVSSDIPSSARAVLPLFRELIDGAIRLNKGRLFKLASSSRDLARRYDEQSTDDVAKRTKELLYRNPGVRKICREANQSKQKKFNGFDRLIENISTLAAFELYHTIEMEREVLRICESSST